MTTLEKDEVTRREVTLTENGELKKVFVEEFRDKNGFYASETQPSISGSEVTYATAMQALNDSLKDARRILGRTKSKQQEVTVL